MTGMRALFACAVLALSIGISTATAGGGNSDNAKLCQKGGWQTLVGADGTVFTNEGDCVSFGAHGGTLSPTASQLDCDRFGGTFAGPTGTVLWTCTNWTFVPGNAGFGANNTVLENDCTVDGGVYSVDKKQPPINSADSTCSRP